MKNDSVEVHIISYILILLLGVVCTMLHDKVNDLTLQVNEIKTQIQLK